VVQLELLLAESLDSSFLKPCVVKFLLHMVFILFYQSRKIALIMNLKLNSRILVFLCITNIFVCSVLYYMTFPQISTNNLGLVNICLQAVCLLGMALISVAFLSSSQATLLNFLEKSIPNSIIPAIMLGTICIGIINVWYITEQVILPDAMANYHSLFLTTNILSTIISIAIGWLFQSVLVYLLAVSLGSQSSFRFYCSAVGVAYSGLFLAAICHLVYTFFTLDTAINLQDLQSFLALSRERNSISRFGEFSMLVALSYLILRYEKLDTISKLTIAFVPTILLGVLSAFLKSAFNVSI
jgi:hypothetical protein